MTPSELVDELAARAGVSRADARAVVEALADIAREQARAGAAFSLAEFGREENALDVLTAAVVSEAPVRNAYADSGAPILGGAPYVPSSREVDDLIATASAHPLGIEFLLSGQVGAVAVTFGTHAFTVEAARQRLAADGAGTRS